MTKYVYVVNQHDCESWETYWDGINKIFSTEESAKAYVEENKNTVFPEDRESWDKGWSISPYIRKKELYG
jgi:hypothetical protein